MAGAVLNLGDTYGTFVMKPGEDSPPSVRTLPAPAVEAPAVIVPPRAAQPSSHFRNMSNSSDRFPNEDPNTKYELLDELGKGSYGSVYKGRDRITSELVAIKVISLADGEEGYEEIRGEIEMLQQCNHPNVVRYMGSYTGQDYLWIVMEYCGGGSVADLMSHSDEPLEEAMIAFVCREALKGLAYLHSIFKVHRDIKGGNILLTDSGEVKLGDFGVAAQLTRTMSKRNTFIGTPHWMAPEVIQESLYDGKVDVWALGVTAIEMAEGLPPRSNVHPMRVLFMISREPPPTLADPGKWSLLFHDFVAKSLTKEPRNRPSATTLLEHKFIEKCKGSAVLIKKRIDKGKAMKAALKKQAIAYNKEHPSSAADGGTWEAGGTMKVSDDIMGGTVLVRPQTQTPATPPAKAPSGAVTAEEDPSGEYGTVLVRGSGTVQMKRPVLPQDTSDPLARQMSTAGMAADLASSSPDSSAAAISAANLAAAKLAMGPPKAPGRVKSGHGETERKDDSSGAGKEGGRTHAARRVDDFPIVRPTLPHTPPPPPHPSSRGSPLPRGQIKGQSVSSVGSESSEKRRRNGDESPGGYGLASETPAQRGAAVIPKALQDKLLAVYAAGSTVPIPFLRANEVSPLALIGSFGEDGVPPDQAALEAIQDLSSGTGLPDGIARKNRRSPVTEMPLPPSVYKRLASSTTLSNLARALAYHKQCYEEMPLQGLQIAQEQGTIQNLSDTLRTILRL